MPSSLINQQLVDELVQRQMAEEQEPIVTEEEPKKDPYRVPATIAYMAGLGADGLTTGYALGKHKELTEGNRMWNWAPRAAVAPLAVGGNLALYYGAKKLLGNRYPKIFDMLLAGKGALHGRAAIQNIGQIRAANDASKGTK